MKVKEVITKENSITSIQLTKGQFKPADASFLILNMINQKINFHKIQRHQLWEGNHQCSTEQIDLRIEELETEIVKVRALIQQARESKYNLKIDGKLTISFEKIPNS